MLDQELWFKNKRYGWGWTPANWKGWLCIGFYMVSLLIYPGVQNLQGQGVSPVVFLILALILTCVLIAISAWKGEKPEWRWGTKKRPQDLHD